MQKITFDELNLDISFLISLAKKAGEEIMNVFNSDFDVFHKEDSSPVTIADKNAEKIITEGLNNLFPEIPVIAEEASSTGSVPDISVSKYFWLVDPLDGTKEFVKKGKEFTVNIALIKNKKPVVGVIYAPFFDELFYAIEEKGSYSNNGKLEKRRDTEEPYRIISSRRHGLPEKIIDFTKGYKIKTEEPISSSLKFCRIAEGKADIYPRFGKTCEWDTAAGHIILKETGGIITNEKGEELSYGNKPFINPDFFAYGYSKAKYLFSCGNVKPFSNINTIEEGASLLQEGKLVSFPTETVYGLGANAQDDVAVASIYKAKGRPSFNPLIVHIYDKKQLIEMVYLNKEAEKLIDNFWPGSLTLVLKRKENCKLSHLVSAGLDTVAVRMPNHKTAIELLKKADRPISAPSANASGTISPTRAYHVAESLGQNVDLIVDGGSCSVGLESTVVYVADENITILRAGGVTKEQIEAVLGRAVAVSWEDPKAPRSPGQLASHYAPSVPIRLNVESLKEEEVLLGFGDVEGAKLNLSEKGCLLEAASNLFAMMRELDNGKNKKIAVSPIPMEGLGLAINDRLRRASAPRKI